MTASEIIIIVIATIGGYAAVLGGLGYLVKSLLDKLIVRDTKLFETNLKMKSDAAIEKLRNDFQIQTIEHQVRFSRLHEKRAQVVAELNGRLAELLWEAESFLSPMEFAGEPDKNKKYALAMNKIVECLQYFDKHRIYLPSDLCASLEELMLKVRALVIKFGVYVQIDQHSVESRKAKDKIWIDGWEAIKNEIPIARKALEDDFRKLLGQ